MMEPLNVVAQSPEVYRASIQVMAMDTQYKGCELCGSDRVLHIESRLSAVDVCTSCLDQIRYVLERTQRKGAPRLPGMEG